MCEEDAQASHIWVAIVANGFSLFLSPFMTLKKYVFKPTNVRSFKDGGKETDRGNTNGFCHDAGIVWRLYPCSSPRRNSAAFQPSLRSRWEGKQCSRDTL